MPWLCCPPEVENLCYQLPALIRGGLVVVISPLVALMEDQVLQLQRRDCCCLFHAGWIQAASAGDGCAAG